MRLDYMTQLSPNPITLPFGTIIKPVLSRICGNQNGVSYDRFSMYEVFAKMTPKRFVETAKKNPTAFQLNVDEIEQNLDSLTMFDLILRDIGLQQIYTELFNFFFDENVVFFENSFIVVDKELPDDIPPEEIKNSIHGVLGAQQFAIAIDIIQQVCCIHDKNADISDIKFKNDAARRIYEKIHKSEIERSNDEKIDYNLSIPNLISKVSAKHPSINILNIWDLTVFQLLDQFMTLQGNAFYDIDSARVSTWGDEKKTFDATLWYKNTYDTN